MTLGMGQIDAHFQTSLIGEMSDSATSSAI
jgi:hypothetical protein